MAQWKRHNTSFNVLFSLSPVDCGEPLKVHSVSCWHWFTLPPLRVSSLQVFHRAQQQQKTDLSKQQQRLKLSASLQCKCRLGKQALQLIVCWKQGAYFLLFFFNLPSFSFIFYFYIQLKSNPHDNTHALHISNLKTCCFPFAFFNVAVSSKGGLAREKFGNRCVAAWITHQLNSSCYRSRANVM